jgi:hypothetical protein
MERWFGLSNGPGMGIAWRLEYRWPWPSWATLLAVLALAAVVVVVYLRESRQAGRGYRLALASMRLLSIGLVLMMIAQIGLFLQKTGLPFVVVIIDDTQSMNTPDQYDEAARKALEDRIERAGIVKQPHEDGGAAKAQPTATDARDKAPWLTRWNIARALFTEKDGKLLDDLSESHKLRFLFLSEMKESQHSDVPGIVEELKAAQAKGDRTPLGAAIRGALDELRGTTPAALVLATDGINTEGPGLLDAADYARRKGVPLLLIGLGSDRPARYLKLRDLDVEDVVFVNDLVHFRFKFSASGFAGKKLTIVLREEKQPGGSPAEKARIEVTAGADGRSQDVVLPYRPTQTGDFRYVIDVQPPAGDPVVHEPLARSIHVREEKVRVLLVDGSPRWEYRYLRNLLARDKTIELDTFLQDADVDWSEQGSGRAAVRPAGQAAGSLQGGGVSADGTRSVPATLADGLNALATFPVRREDLSKRYDVVIFGDVNPSLLGSAAVAALADFVDHGDGGAVVLVAGQNFMPQAYRDTPLARLMPFDPAKARNPEADKPLTEGFVAQPTALGLASPAMQLGDSPEKSRAIWQNLPPLYWMTEVSDLKPSARVLAEHPTRNGPNGKRLPLFVMQYVGGGGKVLFHATDETYRWRRGVEDMYFARYWVQSLRLLSRAKPVEGDGSARLSADRREYPPGDPVRLQVRFSNDRLAPLDDNGVIVELEQAGRQTQRVPLRRSESGRGRFEAVLNNLPPGDFHAKMIAPALPGQGQVSSADFRVVPPQTEMVRLQVNAAEMQQAAEVTKGGYYTYKDVSRLIDDLPAGRQVPVESLPPVPLWNRWPLLALFLTLLIGEWWLRKRKGMV